MKTETSDVRRSVALTPELAEELARMDEAYQKDAEGLPSLEKDWEFVLLGLRSEVVEQVEAALEAEGMTRADLAREMGVSRAHVSKILNESGNFQLETIAKLSVALNRDIALRFIQKTEEVVVKPARVELDVAEWRRAIHVKTPTSSSSFSAYYQEAGSAKIIELSEVA